MFLKPFFAYKKINVCVLYSFKKVFIKFFFCKVMTCINIKRNYHQSWNVCFRLSLQIKVLSKHWFGLSFVIVLLWSHSLNRTRRELTVTSFCFNILYTLNLDCKFIFFSLRRTERLLYTIYNAKKKMLQ